MRIDAGLDTGDMLLKAETEIGADENSVELGRRLAATGARLLVDTLAGLSAGTIVPEKQDAAQATWAPLLKKQDGLIDWTRDASAIHNQVRGLQPWPGAYTKFRGHSLHVWKSRVERATPPAVPGTTHRTAHALAVACGSGAVELLEVQMEGRKRLPAADFANGQRLADNEILGG
jgi:methionyl-tRNA formyltransferase